MTNVAWAKAILDQLILAGVDEVIVCPGARNAPFVEVLAHWQNGKVHSFFEERSAGFFALGRIAATQRPKAVIMTSGTAVANLLPSVIEAHYAGFPLVVVSADRPKKYRGTGSPQTIVQPGIFSSYAETIGDWERGEVNKIELRFDGPSHLNICFDEPLIDEPVQRWSSDPVILSEAKDLEGSFASLRMTNPLILVGGISPQRRELVFEWLKKQKCPVYLEGTSGLRGALPSLELRAAEKTAKLANFDSVIRVGHVPTLRLWRDLENSQTPVLSISDLPFSGLGRGDSQVIPLSSSMLEMTFAHNRHNEILERDNSEFERLELLLEQLPQSEPAIVNQISRYIHSEDSVYIGNSLPIREWDLAARREVCFSRCFANRGANGIDGQISTFLGWAKEKSRNWAILGDLTAMYDLSSPWALKTRSLDDIRIVIINNGGGKIFAPMFRQKLFENRHELSFSAWASMWNMPYSKWTGETAISSGVTEVTPDENQTETFRSLW